MHKKWSALENLLAWYKTFAPAQIGTDNRERLRACAGMLAGLFLTGLATRAMLGSYAAIPMLLAPIGASAVLLFGVPASPLAQPWSIVGGNMLSDQGLHHIPIVNEERRLIGMVTQSDLVAALYRGRLADTGVDNMPQHPALLHTRQS